jgi:hypothetical protein
MKKKYILLILCTYSIAGNSQNFEWAKRAGLWAYDYGLGAGTDNAGNVYIAGKYEQNANFSGTVVPCQGNHDIYLAKYTSSGSLLWVRTAGGYSGDYAHCLSIGNSFVYIGGEVEGNGPVKFIGTSTTLQAKGSNDIVIAKYDLNGNLIWARNDGGIYNEEARGITHDAAGNIYACGFFNTKAVFGSSITITGYGDRDIFVAKYSPNGTPLWVRKAGSSGKDEARSIKCDASGNVYVTGVFKGAASFGSQTVYSNGNSDMFIAKYSPAGDLIWVKTAGGSWDEGGWGLAIDNAGKIFVAGEFNASVNFGGMQLNTTGSTDIFVARYNSSGSVEWAKKAGGNGVDRARAIATDGSNLFITGQFSGTAYFGSTTRYSADASDVFVAALNNSGNFLWASSVGGSADAPEDLGFESGSAICTGPGASVYATGAILNGGQFGSTTLNAYSRTDIFLTKLKNGSGGSGDGGTGTQLIASGASWKYLDNGSNQGTAWRTLSYSDAAWKTGSSQLGYGDGDEATVVGYGPNPNNRFITTYFRKTFTIANKSSISGLELSLIRDDGAVVYINGAEVYRSNMPSGTVSYNTLATTYTNNESNYEIANISPATLVNGTNVVAVEVHQNAGSSSDLSFNLKLKTLSGGIIENENSPTEEFRAATTLDITNNENAVVVNWKTPEDDSTEYFIVERSLDQENYASIGVVKASPGISNYEFRDDQLPDTIQNAEVYYRVNMSDYDGKASYTPTKSIGINIKEELEHVIFDFYPNPATNSFTLYVSQPEGQKYMYTLYDLKGQKIMESVITSNTTVIDISSLSAGIYLVGINSADRQVFQEKIVVQK